MTIRVHAQCGFYCWVLVLRDRARFSQIDRARSSDAVSRALLLDRAGYTVEYIETGLLWSDNDFGFRYFNPLNLVLDALNISMDISKCSQSRIHVVCLPNT